MTDECFWRMKQYTKKEFLAMYAPQSPATKPQATDYGMEGRNGMEKKEVKE